MARIVIFAESVRGMDLSTQSVVLGRSKQADVAIDDKLLSRKHCVIEPAGSGWRLVDLKSSNGTYLNGERVECSSLKFDDVIELGNTVILLLEGEEDLPLTARLAASLPSPALEERRAPPAPMVGERWPECSSHDRAEYVPLEGEPRGSRSGIPQLRNPSKARALLEALSGDKNLISRPSRKAARAARRSGKKLESGGSRATMLRDRRKLRAFEAIFAKWASTELLSRPAAEDLIEGYVFHHIVSLAAKHSSELRGVLATVLERILGPETFSGDTQKLRRTTREAIADALAKRSTFSKRGD